MSRSGRVEHSDLEAHGTGTRIGLWFTYPNAPARLCHAQTRCMVLSRFRHENVLGMHPFA